MNETNTAHSLHIEETRVDFGTGPGTLGTSLLPGGRRPRGGGAYEARDLAADLAAVRAWKPKLVLGLLEDREYERLGQPNFKRDVVKTDLPWLFAAIPAGGVPDAVFERAWISLGARIRTYLAGGGRVLVHGGDETGRAGLIVAILLVESGLEPDAALAAARATHPDTARREAEVAYVHAHARAEPEPRPERAAD